MLVDWGNFPTNPMPMDPDSFVFYLKFKCEPVGTVLTHLQSGLPVKKVETEGTLDICCAGGWDSPSSLYKIHAAVLFIHEKAYPNTCGGPFVRDCKEYQRLNNPIENKTDSESNLPFGRNVVQPSSDDKEITSTSSRLQQTAMDIRVLANALRESFGMFGSRRVHAMNSKIQRRGSILSNPATKVNYDSWLQYKKKTHRVSGK